MRKFIAIFLLAGALGIAAGFALGILIYPFWFLTDVAMETLADRETRTALAEGRFVHVNPRDPIHWGQGRATILAATDGGTVLHLGSDFEVGPGPRFHVYLVDRPKITSAADFQASRTTDLGRLRAFKGSQVYPIPPTVDPAGVGAVVIWCKEFNVLISPASLKAATTARVAGG